MSGPADHEALVRRFYAAFAARDAAAMGACYADDATFSDPVFPSLDAAGVRAMWAMLCARAKSFAVALDEVRVVPDGIAARWTAHYRFGPTGRRVVNVVDATFAFRDGLVVRHVDRFDFRLWARQALGLTGFLLGGSAWLASRVRRDAARSLAQWRQASA